ncbi:MAG: hypothetical protein SFY56_05900 [Bacteroidota bacterium]|nr:hypothetical protein [Bacteroidota bacterium]
MKLDADAIIVTSDEPHSKMWHTQLIYTEFLAKDNAVFFVNPPKKWTIKNLFNDGLNKKVENRNLTLLNYNNKLPTLFKWFNKLNENYNEKKISKELKKINAKKIIIWHFDSFRGAFKNNFFNTVLSIKRLYHIIDPFYNNPINSYLCNVADVIVITSPRINNFYTAYLSKVINIPQCLDIELQYKFVNAENSVKLKTNSNYFVLLGTISDDIDFDWLLELLKITNFKLVIIGKKINIINNAIKAELVFSQTNVEYLGVLSPQQFYPVLKNAKAGLIIYNEERRAKICSPLKALNYLISGLPVITNIDCEIEELDNNGIHYCNGITELKMIIIAALENKLVFKEWIVNKYIDQNSLTLSVQKIINTLYYAI